jgi:hypothetical protein
MVTYEMDTEERRSEMEEAAMIMRQPWTLVADVTIVVTRVSIKSCIISRFQFWCGGEEIVLRHAVRIVHVQHNLAKTVRDE